MHGQQNIKNKGGFNSNSLNTKIITTKMLSLIIGKKKIMQYCHCSFVDPRVTRITAYTYNERSLRRLPVREVHKQVNKDKMKRE